MLLLLVIGLPSCDWKPQESAQPLYTKSQVVSDDRIVGVWRRDNVSFLAFPDPEWQPNKQDKIEKAPGADHYLLSAGFGKWKKSSEVHLGRIGRYLFADIESRDPNSSAPTHVFGRIFISRDAMTVRVPVMYDPQAGVLPFEHSGSSLTAVDSTEKLQKFALDHAEDRIAFVEIGLCREGVADCEIAIPRELFKQEPKNIDAGLRLATAYMNRGRFKEAWSTWKQLPSPKQGLRSMDTPLRAMYLAAALIKWGYERNAIAVLDAGSREAYSLRQWVQERNAIAAWNAEKDIFPRSEAWCGGTISGYLLVNRPRRVIAELKKCQNISARKKEAELNAFLRAAAYAQMGDFENARAEALRVQEKELIALSDFAMGRYFTADVELRSLARGRSDLLTWRYLTLRHLDRESAASELLKDPVLNDNKYAPAVGSGPIELKGWRPYLRGDINDTQFLASVHSRKGQYVQPELCVGYFLIGEKHLLDGDRKGALKYFRKASETHAYTNVEWVIANARVKQLRGKRIREDAASLGASPTGESTMAADRGFREIIR